MHSTVMSPYIHRIAAFCAFWMAVAIPMRAFGVAAEQGALAISLIAALAFCFLNEEARTHIKAALRSPTGLGAIAIFSAFAVTVPFSFDPMGSLEIGGRTGLFLLATVVVWSAVRASPQYHPFVWKILVVAALLSALTVLLAFAGLDTITAWISGSEDRLFPHWTFKAYAAACMCLIPIVVWAAHRLGGAWAWCGYAFVAMALGVIVLTYNRSALAGVIAMSVAGMVLLAMARRRHAIPLLVTTVSVVGGIVAWIATRQMHTIEQLIEVGKLSDSSPLYLPEWLLDPHRQVIWKFAFERFVDHPLVGNGIDQLNRLPGAHTLIPGMPQGAYVVPSHPHNWLLELLAEGGLIGFGTVAVVLGLVTLRLARNYIRTNDEADLSLILLMAGFWCSALFNFTIWAVWWQLTFFILFALVSATRTSAVLKRPASTPT